MASAFLLACSNLLDVWVLSRQPLAITEHMFLFYALISEIHMKSDERNGRTIMHDFPLLPHWYTY